MIKIHPQIQKKRRALLIVQAVLAVVTLFLLAAFIHANSEDTSHFSVLSHQGTNWELLLSGLWIVWEPSYILLVAAIDLAIGVVLLRLAVLLAVTRTTQPWWFWAWVGLGGALGLIAVIALFWGISADLYTAWGISALAGAGDFACTLLAQPVLATSAAADKPSAS
ncbi:MAG: hypothetical protein LKJ69_04965 [Lactobacillus sp.]|jgi:peptidoglycan/LPS O-acetylase OafA/YrhL|nr:hypothetical protein [Lactobacillus sp.]MCI2032735.1 hypothetical protein [Lactobacillus sp.]